MSHNMEIPLAFSLEKGAFQEHVRKWFATHDGKRRFSAESTKDTLEIEVLDFIGSDFFFEGVTSKGVKRALESNPDATTIRVLIDSPGGSVFDAVAIHSMLARSDARIDVEVLGEASSAASIIAMAGDSILMHTGAQMMIHRPSTGAWGFASDFRSVADMLDKTMTSIVDIYAARTSLDRAKIEQMVNDETWMTAKEAVDLGFATGMWKAPAEPDPKKKKMKNESDLVMNVELDTAAIQAVAARLEQAAGVANTAAERLEQATDRAARPPRLSNHRQLSEEVRTR